MRTQTARITLTHWTSKTLADGTSPIMLAVRFNGQSLLSSHFSCLPKHWNAKNECLKSNYPNYAAINKILQDMKNQAIAAKLQFEQDGTPYTSKMVIEAMKPKNLSAQSLSFKDSMERLISERHLRFSTSAAYDSVFKSFSDFIGNEDFIITEVSNEIIINFAKSIFARTNNANTVLMYVAKIASVIAYANSQEITDHFPRRGVDWVHHNYRHTLHHKAVSEETLEKLKTYYNDMNKTHLFKRMSKVFSLAFYLSVYGLFGLAPIDCAKLKLDNVESVLIKGVECYRIQTTRSKTNKPVSIIVNKGTYFGNLIKQFVETAQLRDGYIFPILQNNDKSYHYRDEKDIIIALKTTTNKINSNLADICDELGTAPITLYSARHSFASHQLNKGTNIGLIANALGRDVSGIGCYLANLSSDGDLLGLTVA